MKAYGKSPLAEMMEASTYAHEICHAFGRWTHADRNEVMMNGNGADSCRFDWKDMDTINPSGL